MSIKSRNFGRSIGFAAMVGAAIFAQSIQAAESEATGDVAERLARLEQQMQRIEAQVNDTGRFDVLRSRGQITARPVSIAYPWKRRMLDGN